MGVSYDIKCSVCGPDGFHTGVSVGIGYLYTMLNIFYGSAYFDHDNPMNKIPAKLDPGFPRFKDGMQVHELDLPIIFNALKDEKSIRKKSIELLKMGAIPEDSGSYSLYFCPKCSYIDDKMHFRLNFGDEVFEPDYKCPECKTQLEHGCFRGGSSTKDPSPIFSLRDPEIKLKCPKCGGTDVFISEEGIMIYWD